MAQQFKSAKILARAMGPQMRMGSAFAALAVSQATASKILANTTHIRIPNSASGFPHLVEELGLVSGLLWRPQEGQEVVAEDEPEVSEAALRACAALLTSVFVTAMMAWWTAEGSRTGSLGPGMNTFSATAEVAFTVGSALRFYTWVLTQLRKHIG